MIDPLDEVAIVVFKRFKIVKLKGSNPMWDAFLQRYEGGASSRCFVDLQIYFFLKILHLSVCVSCL